MRSVLRHSRGFLAAVCAGALSGGLVGVGESLLVSFTSAASDEYWVFLFAVVSYGLLGAVVGACGTLPWQLIRWGRSRERELAQVSAGIAVSLPVFAVGRYHVARRIFGEQLTLSSVEGAVTHVLLLVAAALLGAAVVLLIRTCYRLAGTAGPAAAFVLLVVAATVVGAVASKPSGREIARRPAPSAIAGKPNIILIVADTLRADAVDWAAVHPQSRGGFAKLAADGVRFERSYAQASWTRPSIASILTSQYPSVHGTVQKLDFLPNRALTLAEVLDEQGYWTAAFTTNINVTRVFNFQQGFREFAYLEPSFYFWATDSATKLAVYKGLRVARERFLSSRVHFEHYYQDAAVVDRHVEAWLEEGPPEPFFLFIHYMDPHDPYFELPYNGRGVARVMDPSPPEERAEELRGLYAQSVRYLDGYLKILVDRLEQQGIYDRSVIALTADHGEEFFEHGGWWHGTTLYEEQLRVPLVVKRAAEPLSGQRWTEIARLIDVAPTVMAAAGLPMPSVFQGTDLFARGVSEPVLAEEDLEGNRLRSIRAGRWKLIIANPGNPRGLSPTELYDLHEDAGESRNLAATEPRRVANMRGQLERLRLRVSGQGRVSVGRARSNVADPRA